MLPLLNDRNERVKHLTSSSWSCSMPLLLLLALVMHLLLLHHSFHSSSCANDRLARLMVSYTAGGSSTMSLISQSRTVSHSQVGLILTWEMRTYIELQRFESLSSNTAQHIILHIPRQSTKYGLAASP